MAKVLFIPFSLAASLAAGFVAKKLFDHVWGLLDDEEAPESGERDVPWTKLIMAAALQGAIFRASKAAADRYSRKGFASLTGKWPGEKRPEKA